MGPIGGSVSRRTFARAVVAAGTGIALGAWPAKASAAPGAADWLSGVDSQTFLSRISLPGTHDTGARYGGPLVQCQTLTVTEQLTAGVRFLDVRCRAIDGVFAIHHSQFFQNIFFGDILNECQDFLRAHPRETIVMRVKQEYSTVPDADFGTIFAHYRSRWPGLLWTEARVPRLGEVRGKVVVLADNGGVPGIGWNSGLVDLEDDYDIGTVFDFYNRKWPAVSSHLDAARACAPSSPEKVFITFTSSSGWGLWPKQAADLMAPKLSGYLSGLDRARRPLLGIVVMDYVSAGSAAPVFGMNFG
ncbi:phosphatidylinositol-specific phospholipase C [Amycolatopsis sp. NPDC059021]|uniref:phosphatidylinositol-specific phospholipase C n=1 Tax=Amycolatopsis sp. NPDC059021 TaxID=3346704 RepID=UPI00366CE63A